MTDQEYQILIKYIRAQLIRKYTERLDRTLAQYLTKPQAEEIIYTKKLAVDSVDSIQFSEMTQEVTHWMANGTLRFVVDCRPIKF